MPANACAAASSGFGCRSGAFDLQSTWQERRFKFMDCVLLLAKELAIGVNLQRFLAAYLQAHASSLPQSRVIKRQCAANHVGKMSQQLPARDRASMHVIEEPIAEFSVRHQWEAALALAQIQRQRQRRPSHFLAVEL